MIPKSGNRFSERIMLWADRRGLIVVSLDRNDRSTSRAPNGDPIY
jgi:hypothetical protein